MTILLLIDHVTQYVLFLLMALLYPRGKPKSSLLTIHKVNQAYSYRGLWNVCDVKDIYRGSSRACNPIIDCDIYTRNAVHYLEYSCNTSHGELHTLSHNKFMVYGGWYTNRFHYQIISKCHAVIRLVMITVRPQYNNHFRTGTWRVFVILWGLLF